MVRFFIGIDRNLFNFIATLYDLLIAISRTSVLSQGDIAQFAARIEILLGIFMLFKMSFSLITYIVNPDDFTDKQKGFGKLVQNSVISLILLVLVPYIFQMAFSLQAKILNDNLLAKLLLGEKINSEERQSDSTDNNTNNNATIIDTAGNQMAFYVMLPFFLPNTSITSLSECTALYSNDDFNPACEDGLLNVYKDEDNEQAAQNYIYGIKYESLGLTFRADVALEYDDDDRFYIDYKYPLSTATAVITCLLLITFCIDVGVRSVKLAFLQLIYPIPVISFMDPKSGKDGIFSKWYKMCISTFLSLFIRLVALYFGIYVISRVGRHGMVDIVNGSEITNGWVKLFVIIGILMFVKQMPKMLENLGIKLDGDGKFNLNPLKKLEDGALGGKIISRTPKAAAGAALGLGMGAVGAATGAGIGKGLTGMFSGAAAGLKGKKIGEIHKGQIDANQRLREARANGSTFFGRREAQISNLIGSQGRAGRLSMKDKRIDEQIKDIDNRIKPIKDSISDRKAYTDKVKAMEDRAINKIKNGEAGRVSEQYKALENNAERLRESMRRGGANAATAEEVARAEMAANEYLNNTGMQDYIDNVTGFSKGARIVDSKDGKTQLGIDNSYSQKDAAMSGMQDDLIAMTKNTQTYTMDSTGRTVTVDNSVITSGAAAIHSNAGEVTGSANYDTRTIINPAEAEKQELGQQKSSIYDKQRAANADKSALGK